MQDPRKCLDVAPPARLCRPYQLDASRCISYLTIENSGPIPARAASGPSAPGSFGCDLCQEVARGTFRRPWPAAPILELRRVRPRAAPSCWNSSASGAQIRRVRRTALRRLKSAAAQRRGGAKAMSEPRRGRRFRRGFKREPPLVRQHSGPWSDRSSDPCCCAVATILGDALARRRSTDQAELRMALSRRRASPRRRARQRNTLS